MDIEKWIIENQLTMAIIVGAVVVIAIVIGIVLSARKKAQKKKMMAGNSNLVEVIFDYVVTNPRPIGGPLANSEGYVLFSVNGQPAKIMNRSILVPAGEVVLDYEYTYQTVGKKIPTPCGRMTYTFTAEPGKKYYISFNYMEMKMEHKAK